MLVDFVQMQKLVIVNCLQMKVKIMNKRNFLKNSIVHKVVIETLILKKQNKIKIVQLIIEKIISM